MKKYKVEEVLDELLGVLKEVEKCKCCTHFRETLSCKRCGAEDEYQDLRNRLLESINKKEACT